MGGVGWGGVGWFGWVGRGNRANLKQDLVCSIRYSIIDFTYQQVALKYRVIM